MWSWSRDYRPLPIEGDLGGERFYQLTRFSGLCCRCGSFGPRRSLAGAICGKLILIDGVSISPVLLLLREFETTNSANRCRKNQLFGNYLPSESF